MTPHFVSEVIAFFKAVILRSSVCIQASAENEEIGVAFMERAANTGDRSAMIYLAKAYESGIGLGINRFV